MNTSMVMKPDISIYLTPSILTMIVFFYGNHHCEEWIRDVWPSTFQFWLQWNHDSRTWNTSWHCIQYLFITEVGNSKIHFLSSITTWSLIVTSSMRIERERDEEILRRWMIRSFTTKHSKETTTPVIKPSVVPTVILTIPQHKKDKKSQISTFQHCLISPTK